MDFGHPHDAFWDLSWYEWGLYALRYSRQVRERNIENEGAWDRARHVWAAILAPWSKKKVGPEDLIRLSFDKKDEQIQRRTPEEMKAVMKNLGKKFKK